MIWKGHPRMDVGVVRERRLKRIWVQEDLSGMAVYQDPFLDMGMGDGDDLMR